MLRASIRDPENPLLIIGLSEGNVSRLKAGQPIKTSFRSFGFGLPGNIVIFYGDSEEQIEADLRKQGLITDRTEGYTESKVDQEAALRNDHKHILIATVGLPRSGKTTWAQGQSYPMVCPDSIRLALHGNRFIMRAEPFVWAIAKAMVRALFLAGHSTVILDATNTTRTRRAEWASPEWGLFFKVIDTTRETCLARAKAENDLEIAPVIERMAGQFEPLADDEKPWI